MRRSLLLAGLAALSLALSVAASQAASPASSPAAAGKSQPERVLRYAFPIAETGFDPAQAGDEYSVEIIANIFEAPLRYDYLARPIQLRAQTTTGLPEANADFTEFTLRIRPGIFFADDAAFKGRPRELVAADYAYALKRNFDPRLKSPNYASLQGEQILGLDELRQRSLSSGKPFDYDASVPGLQLLDRYTLRIGLARSSPRFPHQLAHTASAAVAREVAEAYDDSIAEHPVGTGPFRLSEWRRSSRMVLLRNPQFRESFYEEQPAADDAAGQAIARQLRGRRLPMLDRVEVSIVAEAQPRWLAFLGQDFDLVSVPYEFASQAAPGGQLAPHLARRGMRMHAGLAADVIFTYFNMEDPLVGGYTPDKVALRRAIALAYDNEEEGRQLRKGLAVPAQSVITPNTYGYLPEIKTGMSEHSLVKARALLDMYGYTDRDGDGWRDQPDGSPLLLEYHTQPDSTSRQFNELWRKHMDALQLRMEFKHAAWPEQMKRARAGKLMIWMLSWTASGPDADSLLATAYGPARGEDNLARFALPEYDRLVERTRLLPDGPERLALIQQAKRLLAAYMPMKAHVHRMRLRLSQPWLQGYQPHPFIPGFWRYVDSLPPRGKP